MINWLKGIFVHKKHDKNHFPVERYTGLTCIGYKCHGCSYEWYEKRSTPKMVTLKHCPFCGAIPKLPDGDGTQYDIECDCGHASSGVQISDLMTIEERQADDFENYRYQQVYIDRARQEAIKNWNNRSNIS